LSATPTLAEIRAAVGRPGCPFNAIDLATAMIREESR
jgi:hypothetical protein